MFYLYSFRIVNLLGSLSYFFHKSLRVLHKYNLYFIKINNIKQKIKINRFSLLMTVEQQMV